MEGVEFIWKTNKTGKVWTGQVSVLELNHSLQSDQSTSFKRGMNAVELIGWILNIWWWLAAVDIISIFVFPMTDVEMVSGGA